MVGDRTCPPPPHSSYSYVYTLYLHIQRWETCVTWPMKVRGEVIMCCSVALDVRIGSADKEQTRAKKV